MSAPPMRKVRVMANDTQPMDVVVHGRQVQITQRFRGYVSDKLSRLDRFGVPLQVIDCEVIRQQNPRTTGTGFIVELTGRGRGPGAVSIGTPFEVTRVTQYLPVVESEPDEPKEPAPATQGSTMGYGLPADPPSDTVIAVSKPPQTLSRSAAQDLINSALGM